MKKIGAFVGKFYPPHIGHLSVVDNLVEKLDELWIIISYNKIRNQKIKNETDFQLLSPFVIKSWFEEHYKSNTKVKIAIFDESNFRPYPEDRDKWADEFKRQFPTINIKIADESYREYNKKYFPEYEFLCIDRDVVNIHSTQIRNNLKNNLRYIIPEARKFFEQKLDKKIEI